MLDAQHFGLPERRRRLFVVVDFGGGADPATILFERKDVRDDSAESERRRQDDPLSAVRGAQPYESHQGRRSGAQVEAPGWPGPALLTPSGGRAGIGVGAFCIDGVVRRFTPTEAERLMGFPDGYTAGQANSDRYRQLGNSFPVPVIRWIGQRIENNFEKMRKGV